MHLTPKFKSSYYPKTNNPDSVGNRMRRMLKHTENRAYLAKAKMLRAYAAFCKNAILRYDINRELELTLEPNTSNANVINMDMYFEPAPYFGLMLSPERNEEL